MGLWGSIKGAVSKAADAVTDVVTEAAGAVGDTIAVGAKAVDTATFGVAGKVANAADDYVFDTVDYLSAGTLDVDFDDGKFSLNTGIQGLATAGATVGEDGITAKSDAIVGGNFELGLTDDGFLVSAAVGIDYGPLPYAEGHVKLDENGDISIGGRAQGTLPTPYGIFSGSMSGGFVNTSEGWGTYMNSDGSWTLPTGVTLRGGETFAYSEDADGSHLSVGVHGGVGYMGMASVDGGIGYERHEQPDGDVVSRVHVEAEADVLGIAGSAEADRRHAEIDGEETTEWSGDADVEEPGLDDAIRIGRVVAQEYLGGDDVAGAGAEVPLDDFGAAIESADAMEQSMSSLTQDLTEGV